MKTRESILIILSLWSSYAVNVALAEKNQMDREGSSKPLTLSDSNEAHPSTLQNQAVVNSQITANLSRASKKKCRGLWSRLASVGIGIGILYSPRLIHGVFAWAQGRKHIGFRIYYSFKEILKTLNPVEKLAYDKHRKAKDKRALIELFYNKLSGFQDADFSISSAVFHKARHAEKFIKGESEDRGVCRHKGIIFGAILDDLGIENEVLYSVAKSEGANTPFHVFVVVYYDGEPFVYDLYNEVGPIAKKEYYEVFNVKIGVPMVLKILPNSWIY